MEKIILWLLGVPLSVILVLWLVLGIHWSRTALARGVPVRWDSMTEDGADLPVPADSRLQFRRSPPRCRSSPVLYASFSAMPPLAAAQRGTIGPHSRSATWLRSTHTTIRESASSTQRPSRTSTTMRDSQRTARCELRRSSLRTAFRPRHTSPSSRETAKAQTTGRRPGPGCRNESAAIDSRRRDGVHQEPGCDIGSSGARSSFAYGICLHADRA